MKKVVLAVCALVFAIGGAGAVGMAPAGADPATAGAASGYGANLDLAGTAVIDEGGLATAALPPTTDDTDELILLPAEPVAISGTFTGQANAHVSSEVPSALEQVDQTVPGPYNVRAVGLAEDLELLLGPEPAAGTPDLRPTLVSASAVRAEAVGVCRGGVPVYDADSEVVDLNIGGTDIPVNAPLTDLIDAVENLVDPLATVVNVERNQVVVNAQGASVIALRVTVLAAAGGEPLVDLVVGRAEVGALACGPAVAQCADTQDNDGDGVIDAQDPGCVDDNGVYDPTDNDERNECIDGINNDAGEDTLIDAADPGCTDPQDDDESDQRTGGVGGTGNQTGGALARTGFDSSTTVPLAIGMGVLAFGALALRRRSTS